MKRIGRFEKYATVNYLIEDCINYIIYFIALIIILEFFGINLTGKLISLGVIGIAVSFAAKDIVSNFFSGIILIVGKSIKVGDTVEIDGKKGLVERISFRSTMIVDDAGIKHVVPNSTLTNNLYLQFKTPEKYRVDIIIGIPLKLDIEDFKDYIVEKISGYDGILETPTPDVYSRGIKYGETQLKVSFWVKDFNTKDYYKLIITNEIRKYMEMGE